MTSAHEEALHLNAEPLQERARRTEDAALREKLLLADAIAQRVRERGGHLLVVGGYVRDAMLHTFGDPREPKDLDLEVYGMPFDQLYAMLREFGATDIVGESFKVIRVGGLDVSIPRKDSKTGKGHRDFAIEGDPHMPVEEAARRRDFTVNALAMDPSTGQIVDSFGGVADMQHKLLRATDETLFADDPLRALRAMQFAARFGFTVEDRTANIIRAMELHALPKERIGEEWAKMLLKSERPSVGLAVARDLKIIEKLHPELHALIGVEQEPEWHPEGDVWTHTLMAVDAAAEIVKREHLDGEQSITLLLAELCHDLGKPMTTEVKHGRITSHGHTEQGIAPTKRFLASISAPGKIQDAVTALVKDHLYPSLNRDASNSAIGRLVRRLGHATLEQLVWVAEADHRGRTQPWDGFPAGKTLLERAAALRVTREKPKRLITGNDVLAEGVPQGPLIGRVLQRMEDAQLDGAFADRESGLAYFRSHRDALLRDG